MSNISLGVLSILSRGVVDLYYSGLIVLCIWEFSACEEISTSIIMNVIIII
jgi:hypothetical protein